MPTFSATLLAGGQSKRMGRDKALLPHPGGGLFWQHQLALLVKLNPQEIFWSGPARENLPARVRVIADAVPDAGPLAGLAACLAQSQTDLLIVLAVDLANMHTDFLRRLLAASDSMRGTVATQGNAYEPLAAVYPRAMRELAAVHLAQGRLELQELVREAVRCGMMQAIQPAAEEVALLRNFNEPGDLAAS